MGMAISRRVRILFVRKEMRILMIGLDAAGKATILYKLKLGENVTTIPTIDPMHHPSILIKFSPMHMMHMLDLLISSTEF
ncbi:hypothetical protein Dsin_029880 [Dipteronia sinensis]|uniref:ADP-ribosylation factor n=1 Tax=Dipteronia sinensis TaxID=43782 RepID=A0AAD9ZTX3_9ROSI|nr:hypothetical protein Dsin_029880 [Dipteronia sinensis]